MSAQVFAFPSRRAPDPAAPSAEELVAQQEEWPLDYAARRAPEIAGQIASGNIEYAFEVAVDVTEALRRLVHQRQRPVEDRAREIERNRRALLRSKKGAATRQRNKEAREAALAALGLALTADGVERVEGGAS